jgi:hypothetical protein
VDFHSRIGKDFAKQIPLFLNFINTIKPTSTLMKKVWVLMAAASIFLTAQLQAQNVVKINIFSPIVKTFNIQYERAINETSSFQLGLFYTGYSNDDTKFSGFGITPEYRFYLSETPAPQGVYVAPFVRYQSFKIEEKDVTNSEADFSAFGGGLILGKQWVFKEKVVLDIFIGPAYYSGKISGETSDGDFDTDVFDGFGIRTGICFGLNF